MHAEAKVLLVGDELLEGRVSDRNLAVVAEALSSRGLAVSEARVSADSMEAVSRAVREMLGPGVLLVTTGGLGPTDDDMTLSAVASTLGLPLVRNAAAESFVRDRYRIQGVPCPSGALVQADIPEGSRPVRNPAGVAPGIVLDSLGGTVISLPGVPREAAALVGPCLDEAGLAAVGQARQAIVRTWGIPEQELYDLVRREGLADTAQTAFLPRPSMVDLKLRGPDSASAARRIAARLGRKAYAVGEWRSLEAVLGGALQERGLTLGVAESCTGGMLGARLTSVPGSSGWFAGGVIAYSDRLKSSLLGVGEDLLAAHGAVSEETARAMARGVLEGLGAGAALAVTGIAGPAGGTPEKPVGTVWIAATGPGFEAALANRLWGDRDAVREGAVARAMGLLWEMLG